MTTKRPVMKGKLGANFCVSMYFGKARCSCSQLDPQKPATEMSAIRKLLSASKQLEQADLETGHQKNEKTNCKGLAFSETYIPS